MRLKRLERQLLEPVQLQICLAGEVESGKSTLIGVLSSDKLDNGKGLARMQIFKHNHEVYTGNTSSISQHNLFFSIDGKVLNNETDGSRKGNRLRSKSELELADITARVVSFIGKSFL